MSDNVILDQKGYTHTDPPMDWQDELILWCVVIAVLAVVLLVLSGVVK